MSAEPDRRKRYDKDLRWRVVYQRIGMNLSLKEISANLSISISTVCRVCALFQRTGGVEVSNRQKRRYDLRRLDEQSELFVVGLVIDSPTLYLAEICKKVHDVYNVSVSAATICRLLRSYGFTRKKIRNVALQRSYSLRGAFMSQCFMFNVNQFVWIDETGSDARDQSRKYGYSLRGQAPVVHRFLSRGKRVNAIAAISTSGLVSLELVTRTVNGEVFFDYVRSCLIPNMMPFDGVNPRSIAIMDNCSVHHVNEVLDLFHQAGILVLFLPPYSPDLNPCEEAFSFIKSYLRKHDELLQVLPNPLDVIKSAFNNITENLCTSWINHSGYN